MHINKLIPKELILDMSGTPDAEITAVSANSGEVTPGALFVAVRGLTTDGHLYIDDAVEKGALAVVCEKIPGKVVNHVCYIKVQNPAAALGNIAAAFYGHPSREIKLVGVTGTNGKTTVVSMLFDVFTALGHKCGMLSTIINRVGQTGYETRYTTPDPVSLNRLLKKMTDSGCTYAFMEVSSHALDQLRTEGISFAGAVFTNLSHEHLDYHKSFKEYLRAKQSLFNNLEKEAFALTNLDDKNGFVVLQNTKAEKKTYSLNAMADFKARVLENTFQGLHIQIGQHQLWSKLTGTFNACNILAVYATGVLLGQNDEDLLRAISQCDPPEGRFDYFTSPSNITAIVDYAHTPDALEKVLQNIQQINAGKGQLITVIGCGGNRDREKRGPMAVIAAKYSDRAFFTSDNPRNENPEAIIDEMIEGLEVNPDLKNKYIAITNRKEAIKVACVTAAQGDIILVAGKGHEKYQEIRGERLPFDDKALLHEFLNR
ncbi:MAG: UDP-N-acetylmuramoyl-L-alanyl-D-glutamate--2,6-diaminopimelate ligase [Bacteroidales bacterium]|nr:UDP-N-acetylmuramoyl-L-alanyl-D-glutamate--2,6-diaminopimelate ligase [Bacteroidales bacterium]